MGDTDMIKVISRHEIGAEETISDALHTMNLIDNYWVNTFGDP